MKKNKMGDITLKTRLKTKEQEQEGILYFDTGLPETFIREDKANELGNIMKLPQPVEFNALGDGKFHCNAVIQLYVKLEDVWCRHLCYVASIKDIDTEILIGHDFMQKFDINLNVKKRQVIINQKSLLMAQRIR
ncbi:MAG: hypothetical protein AB1567_03660 [bacterium]